MALGDDQASSYLVFLTQCKAVGWTEEAEEVIGRLYLDFNENLCRVLGNNPAPIDILDYIMLKAAAPLSTDVKFLQSPSEILSVILVGAALFDLDDALDELAHRS